MNGKVVSRLMKIDTNLKYLPSEDLFNEIYDLHVGSGHCGRDLLNKKIKEKFANVTIENISAFLKTCQFCTTKRKSSEKKRNRREANFVKRCIFALPGGLHRLTKLP